MNVLVDTSAWSLSLRRKKRTNTPIAVELANLINEGRVLMLGAIRQELLSGISDERTFEMLRKHLRAFPDVVLESGDFERAAEFFNACRARGVQGSNTDFLICAVAHRLKAAIFTTDRDFERFRKVVPFYLYERRSSGVLDDKT